MVESSRLILHNFNSLYFYFLSYNNKGVIYYVKAYFLILLFK